MGLLLKADLDGCPSIELDGCGSEPIPTGFDHLALTVAFRLCEAAVFVSIAAALAGVLLIVLRLRRR